VSQDGEAENLKAEEQSAEDADDSIAVIGGGLIGLSIAWELARAGWRSTVYEKGRFGGEASWAAAGMLSPGGEVEGPSALASLAIESRDLYGRFVENLEQASGLGIDYQECGGLDLAYSPEELRVLEERARVQAAAGIESRPVTAAHIVAFWPRVRREGLAGGRFYPKDGVVNPQELVTALAKACRRAGIQIHENCAAARVEVFEKGATVESCRGTAWHDAVVIAAGAWSSDLEMRGAPAIPRAEPVKGHLIGYRQPEHTCATIVRHRGTYLLQRANGLLIAGASVEHVGFDRELRDEIAAGLAGEAAFVFPHLAETAPSEVWVGFRPESDGLHIGAWGSKRLLLAYGHYRNGILLAPVTAARIAAEINANLQTR